MLTYSSTVPLKVFFFQAEFLIIWIRICMEADANLRSTFALQRRRILTTANDFSKSCLSLSLLAPGLSYEEQLVCDRITNAHNAHRRGGGVEH